MNSGADSPIYAIAADFYGVRRVYKWRGAFFSFMIFVMFFFFFAPRTSAAEPEQELVEAARQMRASGKFQLNVKNLDMIQFITLLSPITRR